MINTTLTIHHHIDGLQQKGRNSIVNALDLRLYSIEPSLWMMLDDIPGQQHKFHWLHTYIHTCLLLLISMLWHRQAIFESKGDKLCSSAECRIRTHQGLRHQIASRLNARWQTDWAIEDQAKKLELDSPSLWSASIQPTRPHSRLAFAPGSGDIHVCCC